MVIQFNLRAFYSVRTWPWMMLFYKLRPLLRSAQVEKELASLHEDFNKLKEAHDRFVSRIEQNYSLNLLLCPTAACCLICPPGLWFGCIRSEVKRRDAEERQVVLVQEKNDLALQLQAVCSNEIFNPNNMSCMLTKRKQGNSWGSSFNFPLNIGYPPAFPPQLILKKQLVPAAELKRSVRMMQSWLPSQLGGIFKLNDKQRTTLKAFAFNCVGKTSVKHHTSSHTANI